MFFFLSLPRFLCDTVIVDGSISLQRSIMTSNYPCRVNDGSFYYVLMSESGKKSL